MSKLLSLLVCGLLVFGLAAIPTLADCPDGDGGSNTIDCTSDPGPENNDADVEGNAGDDNITVDNGVTVDGVHGNGGNDTITNNGAVDGDIRGDEQLTEAPGDDSIVNNGSTNAMFGDQGYGDGSDDGDDTLINNGSVDGSIFGDSTGNNGGNDLIVNNGSVGGDINGDNGYTPGGDDTIIVNGSVGGMVSGDSYANANVGSGDDLIELQNDAAGGDDSLLLIDGDGLGLSTKSLSQAGDDTLVFNFRTSSESEYNNLVDQFTAAAASTSATGSGTLTFRGQTFQWINIEELRNLIRLIVAQSGGSGEIVVSGQDGRLNWQDVAAPAAIYCAPGGIHVYSIDANGSGIFLLGADSAAIASAVAAGGGVISEGSGAALTANASGGMLFTLGGYSFGFSASTCTLPA